MLPPLDDRTSMVGVIYGLFFKHSQPCRRTGICHARISLSCIRRRLLCPRRGSRPMAGMDHRWLRPFRYLPAPANRHALRQRLTSGRVELGMPSSQQAPVLVDKVYRPGNEHYPENYWGLGVWASIVARRTRTRGEKRFGGSKRVERKDGACESRTALGRFRDIKRCDCNSAAFQIIFL